MTKICKDCGDEFIFYQGKPGLINQCVSCAKEVPLLGGNMIYEHKTAGYIEIKSMNKAKDFAMKVRRFGGQGVTASLVTTKN